MPRLENWGIVPLNVDPYQPPECLRHGLHGTVFDHKAFADGDQVTTSEVKSLRLEGDNVVAISATGSEYLLGAVAPEYEKLFPNARERLIRTFEKGGALTRKT